MKKKRLDIVLIERGLASNVKEASFLIMDKRVLSGDIVLSKAGELVPSDLPLRLRGEKKQYVSRAGKKLETALHHFKCDVHGLVALDVGASTGGFTDCLLQHGVSKVFALDVGYGQLDMKLQHDERVVVLDRTNLKTFSPEGLGEKVDLVVMDVSFISARSLLPYLPAFLKPSAHIIVLVKPQFELPAEKVGDGGIVQNLDDQKIALQLVLEAAENLGWSIVGEVPSSILGAKGNQEYLLVFRAD